MEIAPQESKKMAEGKCCEERISIEDASVHREFVSVNVFTFERYAVLGNLIGLIRQGADHVRFAKYFRLHVLVHIHVL
jgi:hypothetical protein